MQINSVNQLMSYPKSSQNQNVKNLGRNNQPSFGRLLNLKHNFDFHLLDKSKANTICVKLINDIMSTESVKSFFKMFDADMEVADIRCDNMVNFLSRVTPKKYLEAEDYTKLFLQRYKDAGVTPNKKLISQIPKNYYSTEEVIGALYKGGFTPDCYRLDVFCEEGTAKMPGLVSLITESFENLKNVYVRQYKDFLECRFEKIDEDINNKLELKRIGKLMKKKTTINTMMDDFVQFQKEKFNSEL